MVEPTVALRRGCRFWWIDALARPDLMDAALVDPLAKRSRATVAYAAAVPAGGVDVEGNPERLRHFLGGRAEGFGGHLWVIFSLK
jgi:hypothetical protein